MLGKTFLWIALFSAPAVAAVSGFLLGVDYSIAVPPYALQIATDAAGHLYTLTSSGDNLLPPNTITKLASDGKTQLWQYTPSFGVGGMAVDPTGAVYLIPQLPPTRQTNPNLFVEKLSADGKTVLWQTPIPPLISYYVVFLAVDSTGRAFVAGSSDTTFQAYLVRLNAAGTVDYTTKVKGGPVSLAVDASGTHVAVGIFGGSGLGPEPFTVALVELDSNTTWYSAIPYLAPTIVQFGFGLAVASNGDIMLCGTDIVGRGMLIRMTPTGTVKFSTAVTGVSAMATDAAGNAYVAGYSGSKMVAVRNSLALCGSSVWLSVFAPDGSLLQSTYLPVSANTAGYSIRLLLAAAANSVIAEVGPYPAGSPNSMGITSDQDVLVHLSANSNAQTLPLACIGNAANGTTGPIAPGEIVTLLGSGLGPVDGVAPPATQESSFPAQVANVAVTFDGKPAPLLWVQDSQINLQVPWSLTNPTTEVCASYQNVQTNCLTVPVALAAPGVFMADSFYALALNEDGTMNSATNPAGIGSIVSVFATGLGPVSPLPADGSLAPSPAPVNTFAISLESPCVGPAGCIVPAWYGGVTGGPSPFLVAGISEIRLQAGFGFGFLNLVVTTSQLAQVPSNYFYLYVTGP